MRLCLIISLLLVSLSLYPQENQKKPASPVTAETADSIAQPPDSGLNGFTPLPVDTAMIRQNMNSGLDYLLRVQEENRRKQKRNAMMRIGFGVAMLVVLIIGLLRKKRKV